MRPRCATRCGCHQPSLDRRARHHVTEALATLQLRTRRHDALNHAPEVLQQDGVVRDEARGQLVHQRHQRAARPRDRQRRRARHLARALDKQRRHMRLLPWPPLLPLLLLLLPRHRASCGRRLGVGVKLVDERLDLVKARHVLQLVETHSCVTPSGCAQVEPTLPPPRIARTPTLNIHTHTHTHTP
jgi:hypothetical protein